jgi:hypothetical protein
LDWLLCSTMSDPVDGFLETCCTGRVGGRMIQIVLDPYVLAAVAALAVLIYDLFRGLRADWRDARTDDPEHSL